MHVRLKLNSQVYVNLARYHLNRIIVELSAKCIDLLYLKRICHKRDKKTYSLKDSVCVLVFIFIFGGLFCLYDFMLVFVALEHVSLI